MCLSWKLANASRRVTNWNSFAKEGLDAEHSLTTSEAIKKWSVVVSFTVIMEGYDVALLGNFYVYPSFQQNHEQYFLGTKLLTRTHFFFLGSSRIPLYDDLLTGPSDLDVESRWAWQIALSNASVIGSFFGVFANGWLIERFGHRRVLLVLLVIMTGIFITFFAPNVQVLLAGEILVGFPWGIFASMGPAFASEVMATVFRPYPDQLYQQLLCHWSAGALVGLINLDSAWSFRIPFVLQWIRPLPRPWWLVRKFSLSDAEKSFRRLNLKSAADAGIQQTVLP
jgi:SP family general alpha glucoside:H+ symporter-like MFS transporter